MLFRNGLQRFRMISASLIMYITRRLCKLLWIYDLEYTLSIHDLKWRQIIIWNRCSETNNHNTQFADLLKRTHSLRSITPSLYKLHLRFVLLAKDKQKWHINNSEEQSKETKSWICISFISFVSRVWHTRRKQQDASFNWQPLPYLTIDVRDGRQARLLRAKPP